MTTTKPHPATKPPPSWATGAVRASTCTLPAGAVRDRYRRELSAELYGLTSRQQLAHVAGMLSRTVALRRAVAEADPAAWKEQKMSRKPVLCRMNLHHRWRPAATEDGEKYLRCVRCGKDHPGPRGPSDLVHPTATGF